MSDQRMHAVDYPKKAHKTSVEDVQFREIWLEQAYILARLSIVARYATILGSDQGLWKDRECIKHPILSALTRTTEDDYRVPSEGSISQPDAHSAQRN